MKSVEYINKAYLFLFWVFYLLYLWPNNYRQNEITIYEKKKEKKKKQFYHAISNLHAVNFRKLPSNMKHCIN